MLLVFFFFFLASFNYWFKFWFLGVTSSYSPNFTQLYIYDIQRMKQIIKFMRWSVKIAKMMQILILLLDYWKCQMIVINRLNFLEQQGIDLVDLKCEMTKFAWFGSKNFLLVIHKMILNKLLLYFFFFKFQISLITK